MPANLKELIKRLKSWPVVYQLLLALFIPLYNATLRDTLFTEARNSVSSDAEAPLFGWLIIVILVVQTIALLLKFRQIRLDRIALHPPGSRLLQKPLYFFWVMHIVLSGVLGFIAFKAFGVDLQNSSTIVPMLMSLPVLRDIVLLLLLHNVKEARDQRLPGSDKAAPQPAHRSLRITANLLLTVCGIVLTTVVWEVFAEQLPGIFSDASSYGGIAALLLWTAGIFLVVLNYLMFSMPARFGFYLQEAFLSRDRVEARTAVWSQIFTAVAVMLPIFTGAV